MLSEKRLSFSARLPVAEITLLSKNKHYSKLKQNITTLADNLNQPSMGNWLLFVLDKPTINPINHASKLELSSNLVVKTLAHYSFIHFPIFYIYHNQYYDIMYHA